MMSALGRGFATRVQDTSYFFAILVLCLVDKCLLSFQAYFEQYLIYILIN